MKTSNLSKIALLGSSAGGAEVIGEIVSKMTVPDGSCVLCLPHVEPKKIHDQLEQSKKPYKIIEDGMPLESGLVYIGVDLRKGAPIINGFPFMGQNNMHLYKENEVYKFRVDDTFYVSPIDEVFTQAAGFFGEDCVGVILKGSGGDGSQGLRKIKEEGGKAIVQKRPLYGRLTKDSWLGMPNAAIQTGVVDYVLPTRKISAKLEKLLS